MIAESTIGLGIAIDTKYSGPSCNGLQATLTSKERPAHDLRHRLCERRREVPSA